jgi:3,4-dihydroxy 2-butanone 4-phosphate synthase / GTP cyclohydrolase II
MRSGHTEACVDLCRLAGLAPVGVIGELTNDDGSVRTGPQIDEFAKEHRLARISVAELIAYRQEREKLVERVNVFSVEGPSGPLTGYAYVTPYDPVQHFAFVQGEIGDGRNVPTRLHRVDIVADVIAGGSVIRKTFARFKQEGRGVFVYLRDGTAGVPVNVPSAEKPDKEALRIKEWREIGVGAQILRDLGISSIRLRTSSPLKYVGLSGFGIEIVAYEPVEGES